ncbi:transposase [Acuticoccus sp. I52.16.1]|nr:transposase [Acuticoccus sp. I52.16.1]UOM36710.1 transposase [Acuticoccus sp. I52.16.1]
MSGQIVDATLVAAPRQRLTGGEKAAIKEGRTAHEIWPETPAKARQKDTDARWTMKFAEAKPAADGSAQIDIAVPTYGSKSHISVDRRHGIIRRQTVIDAAAHDGAQLREGLIDPMNTAADVWADTAYRSTANERYLEDVGRVRRIHRRKPRGKMMPKHHARANAKVGRASPRRALLRPPEERDGARGAHHRPRPRRDRHHARQHGLQHEALVLARRARCARVPQDPAAARKRQPSTFRSARTAERPRSSI